MDSATIQFLGAVLYIFYTFLSESGLEQDLTKYLDPNAAILGNQTKQEKTLAFPTGATLATVTKIVDGDTIHVVSGNTTNTVRLIGIDTPEVVDPRRPVQCYGKEASQKLQELINKKKVYVTADASQSERDKYDRLLRYVWTEDGINVNEFMIREGYAYEYTYDVPYKYQQLFKEAQRGAQEKKIGLWSDTTCKGKKEISP